MWAGYTSYNCGCSIVKIAIVVTTIITKIVQLFIPLIIICKYKTYLHFIICVKVMICY